MKLNSLKLLALAALLPMGLVAPSYATPIAYVLSPDVTGVGPGGVTYTVAATFDFDSSTTQESNVDIVVTGAGPYALTYNDDASSRGVANTVVGDICGENGFGTVCIKFVDAIGTEPNTLQGIFFGDQPGQWNVPATGVITGTADTVLASDVSAPEPASVALLGTGLLGLALRRRNKVG